MCIYFNFGSFSQPYISSFSESVNTYCMEQSDQSLFPSLMEPRRFHLLPHAFRGLQLDFKLNFYPPFSLSFTSVLHRCSAVLYFQGLNVTTGPLSHCTAFSQCEGNRCCINQTEVRNVIEHCVFCVTTSLVKNCEATCGEC